MADLYSFRNAGSVSPSMSSWHRGGGRTNLNSRANFAPKVSQPRLESLGGDRKGILLASIDVNSIPLEDDSTKVSGPVVEDCNYIASYNWLDKKHATILVPGSPATWLPPKHETTVKPDSGIFYRDKNAARYPAFPIEPAIRALFALKPQFESSEVDIVGCSNTLGSLLSAARGEERSFHFGVERVGNTIFLLRQTLPKEIIKGVVGYGHTFPETYTSWDVEVKGSVSHQRLIKYSFDGLRCLVRSESDGYFPNKASHSKDQPRPVACPSDDVATIHMAAAPLSVGEQNATMTSSKLAVKVGGQGIPQAAIFDLKTRAMHKEVHIDEFLPGLWVNQTPNFVIARHERGTFTDVRKVDVRASVKDWEKKNAKVLRRFHNMLSQLKELTAHEACSRVQVYRDGTGLLYIRKATQTWSALPKDLMKTWQGERPQRATAGGGTTPDAAGESDSDSEDDEPDDYLKF